MDISSLLSPSQRKQILEQKIVGWADGKVGGAGGSGLVIVRYLK